MLSQRSSRLVQVWMGNQTFSLPDLAWIRPLCSFLLAFLITNFLFWGLKESKVSASDSQVTNWNCIAIESPMDLGFGCALWKRRWKVWVERLHSVHSAFGENMAWEYPYSIQGSEGKEKFLEQTPSVVLIWQSSLYEGSCKWFRVTLSSYTPDLSHAVLRLYAHETADAMTVNNVPVGSFCPLWGEVNCPLKQVCNHSSFHSCDFITKWLFSV